MDTNEIFKYRSVTACMKASYELVTSHLFQILKKTWWASLILAIFTAITIYFRMPNKGLHDWGQLNPWASFSTQTVIYLFTILCTFVTCSALWNWFNSKGMKQNLIRYSSVMLIYAVICIFFFGLLPLATQPLIGRLADAASSPNKMLLLSTGELILRGFIAMICILPFAYILPRNMLREASVPLRPWKSYTCGLRHFGSIFMIGFLGILLIFIITLIMLMPTYILMYVQIKSQLGALEGDPLGIPAYFTPLFLLVMTLTFFFYIYVIAWWGFSFTYLYGAIETQEKEKKERLQAENQEHDVVHHIQ